MTWLTLHYNDEQTDYPVYYQLSTGQFDAVLLINNRRQMG